MRPQTIKRVLLVDDEEAVRDLLEAFLQKEGGYAVRQERLAREAFEKVSREAVMFDVVIGDWDMKNETFNGLELVKRLREEGFLAPGAKLVLMSGYAPPERFALASQAGAKFLAKPFTLASLRSVLES